MKLQVRQIDQYCVTCQALAGQPCIDVVRKHMTGGGEGLLNIRDIPPFLRYPAIPQRRRSMWSRFGVWAQSLKRLIFLRFRK